MENPLPTSANLLTAAQAQPVGVSGLGECIAGQTQSELALRAALEFNQLVINTMQDGFAIIDLNGVQTEANPALCKMTGFSRDELVGTGPPHRFWPPEEYQSIEAAFDRTLQGADESFELTFMRKNGERFPAIISPAAIRDSEGKIISYTATVKDITERKRIELAQQANETQLRAILEAATESIFLMDVTGEVITANTTTAARFGLALDQLIGRNIYELLPPALAQSRRASVDHVIQTRQSIRFIDERGGRWIDQQVFPLFSADGQVTRVAVFGRDITETKQAEILLKERERQLSTLLSNLPGMAYRCLNDNDWTMTFVSDGCMALTGYPSGSLVENRVVAYADLIVPADVEMVWNEVQEALLRKRPFCMNYRIKTANGKEKWVWEQGLGVFAADGTLEALEGFIIDITERKLATQALQASQEKLKTLQKAVEQSATAVVITDTTGTIEYVNPAFEKASGYPAAELIGNNPRVLKSGSQDDAFYRDLWESITSGRVWRGQFHNKRKDGSLYWELATISPVNNSSGETIRFIGVKEDISELKSLEARLRLALDQAETATRAKSDFLANMSHEIRTPLNGVLGLAQMLETEPLTPDQIETVQRINTSGRSLLGIINDILDLSKIEAGRLHIETHPFKLAQVLANVHSMIGSAAHGKGLNLRTEDHSPTSGSLIGDALRLEQVLMNLVSNAVKFTDDGEVVIRIIPLAVTAKSAQLRIEIADSGIGIAPENLAELFTPFTQAEFGIARRFGGTGLGLSICKRLIESMGGTIGVESTLGTGSTFWLELPFERIEDEILPDSLLADLPGPRLQGLRLLVADDSEVNLFLVERLLKREGATATLVKDGKEALDCLRLQPNDFDAVLMDVQMPVMDGLTATRAIRDELKLIHLPVIALTAGVMPEDRDKALASGLNDFLPKPLDLNLMTQVIARHCRCQS
jgi:PAS domain S-box-containing protein